MKTTITICTFKRKKNSKIEKGIAIGEVDIIIDKNLKIVKNIVWNYSLHWAEGTLPIEL
ncbi:MAG TPA: hypothetical protein VF849_00130 [Blattabacteriaceae bacterium]